MKEITCDEIIETVANLCVESATVLPPALGILLECASESEPSKPGEAALLDIIENFKLAARESIPICQDTGMTVVFMDIGQEIHITGGFLEDAVNEGVRQGYNAGHLRKSVVSDPLRRVNTGDNTPCILHTRIIKGDNMNIQITPKGFGSENMSAMKLFMPSASMSDIEDFVIQTVSEAGSNPCPPVVVGVGLGGTIEQCALIAKRALLRNVDNSNPDPLYADLENRLLVKINKLGIGPQGFGGRHTAIAVNVEFYPTHIAGLPCVVNLSCHATRHAKAVL